MGVKLLATTACMAGLLAAAQAGGAAGAPTPSNQNNKPAAPAPTVSLERPVVTLGATSVKRGDSVRIVVQSVSDATGATVSIGGVTLSAEPQGNAVTVQIPLQQPLGPATVVVVVKGREYAAQETLTVLATANMPRIDSIQPFPAVPENGRVALDIFGQGFSTAVLNPQTANDIRLVVNHGARTVLWHPAGLDPAKACGNAVAAAPDAIHGVVVSESQIHVCNVPFKNEGVLPIGLDQGGPVVSKAESVVVSSWNDDLVRGIAAGVAIVLIALVYILVSFKGAHIARKRIDRLRAMLVDKKTNTYSLSILQFHLWTAATLFGYTYFAISRLFVQRGGVIPDVPGGVPGIVGVGIGATTAVAAQLIESVNPKGAGAEGPSPSDLVTSGGAIAPDRVQMLVWTFIGIGMFVAAVLAQQPATIKGLPELPSTLMQLMGLSSIGYLAGKYARKPGPNITELSITPSAASPAGGSLPQIAAVDIAGPKDAAAQTFASLKKSASGLTETTAPAAVREANAAVSALESAVAAAAGATGSTGVAQLRALADSAHNAAVNAAGEFERMGAGTAGLEIARVSASIAQRASAAAEELSETIGSLVSQAEASAARRANEEAQAFRRTIEFRGANLSAEGVFRAKIPAAAGKPENGDEYPIPFRMLEEKDGVRAPIIVDREEGSGDPKFARTLHLNIVPSKLDAADRRVYDAIFGSPRDEVVFTISNPDGQKATRSVKIPPGEAQRQG